MGHIPHWRKQFKSINTYGLREEKTHYLFYKNIIVLHLNKLESPLPKDALWQFGWYWPSGSGDEIFFNFVNYFTIISHWKRAGTFIWTNFNPLHPRMLCAKFNRNWPSGFWEESRNRKSLQMDRQTDRQKTQQAIWKAHVSFQLRWAKEAN